MAEETNRGAAQVNWLVAGAFGLGARGKTLTLTRADFNEVLERQGLEARATIPDRFGADETRTVTLKIKSLKALSLKHVITSVPELTTLLEQADRVSKLKDVTVSEVEAIVGPGKLLERLRPLIEPNEAPKVGGEAGPTSGDVDAIFEKASVPEKSVKSAIDMFVRSTSSSSRPKPRPVARQLRDRIEEAAYGAAADVLRSSEVERIESAWRGLRMLLAECPLEAGMKVTLLETDPTHVVEDLAARDRADDIDEPDCIFVAHDFDSTAPLAELADLAEQDLIPIVVGVSPSLFGAEHPQDVPDTFEALDRARNTEVPSWVAAWDELRLKDSTRWLSAVANRVALHTEGAGAAKRTVFGSGVWGVASMLAASFRVTGGFARIFGQAGSLRAPAAHTVERGSYKDTAAPTEAFYAINACEVLSKNGVLGLGSARNSDTLALVKAPVVRGATDAVPLPAQILTGRVVRFATWVKSQLPEGADSKTANEIFTSAASVFLFPGQEEAAHVRAATTNIDGEAHVVVRAVANPKIASVPFEIAFPLPLGWSVPAPESSDETENAQAKSPVKAGGAQAGEVASIESSTGERGEGVGLSGASVGFDVGLDDES